MRRDDFGRLRRIARRMRGARPLAMRESGASATGGGYAAVLCRRRCLPSLFLMLYPDAKEGVDFIQLVAGHAAYRDVPFSGHYATFYLLKFCESRCFGDR